MLAEARLDECCYSTTFLMARGLVCSENLGSHPPLSETWQPPEKLKKDGGKKLQEKSYRATPPSSEP